jgi:hypothetical protein
MKERLLKSGVTLFLVAVMIMAGVLASYPLTSQAAGGTTYNVVIQKGSPVVSLVSTNGGAPGASTAQNETISFKMVVDAKAKTEKLKTGPASYYPVTILAKSYRAPVQEFPMPGGTAVRSSLIAKDAVGKLYISGGDVDVSSVLGSKMTTVIGDGTVDPAGSMILQMSTVSNLTDKATGKVLMTMPQTSWYTTGKSYCIVKGSKTRLDGKALPNDDTTKLLPTPLVGKPIDLKAGTGTLVITAGTVQVKTKTLGTIDNLTGQIWVMAITK